ncbi:ATP/maltotriose-dependent transcriptional regulator MalT [Arthrobacter ginsengisoli]|uniref:ATP/maltotriose-dependent transcriptional regulator MalT n=1 Tax=Arthrobacter ginsengisoli TaxID=1356565 RepID=A0ABU1UIN4_9MICC|nr:LuxR C-terminal-related transcriptional regulator [Arthrobacter ginsengisoli]MDR7085056.1 ATP/maltotriose-dependent transcriptional regulator MalT [Arthrobacter ginsengisoli]
MLSRAAVLAGDLPEALGLARWHLNSAAETGRPVEESVARSWLATLNYFTGDLRAAMGQAKAATAAARHGDSDRIVAGASLMEAVLSGEQGNLRASKGLLAEAVRLHPAVSDDYSFVAGLAVARSILALAAGHPGEVSDPDPGRFNVYPPILCAHSLYAGLAGLALGAPERAVRQAGYLRTFGPESPPLQATALRLDGLAAAAVGKEGAAGMLLSAARLFDTLGIKHLAAQAWLEWAEVASLSGGDDVRPALHNSLAFFDEQGMSRWADRSRRLARRLGMRPPRRRPVGSPLTGREQEVARLVSEGLPNGEIAARLFLSERTVETHMRNIYANLGVSTRLEIARWIQAKAAAPPGS